MTDKETMKQQYDYSIIVKHMPSKYSVFFAAILRIHFRIHCEEKTHKCNQCDFASVHTRSFRTNLKIYSGEKSQKNNQCNYAIVQAGQILPSRFFFHQSEDNAGDDDKKLEDVNRNVCAKSGMPEAHRA